MEYEIYKEENKSAPAPEPELYPAPSEVPHYYGHWVRRLFFSASILMLLTLPFFRSQVAVPVLVSLLAIGLVTFAAGYTSRQNRWVLKLDVFTSFVGLLIFGYTSIMGYGIAANLLSFVNQILAVIFLVAFYFSIKTLRGNYLNNKSVR